MSISYAQTQSFSALLLDYLANAPSVQPFYRYNVDFDGIAQSIADIQKKDYDRTLLHDVLQKQYSDIKPCNAVAQNIAAIKQNNTWLIATAHQPNLLTGPLYFVYKIVSAIRLAQDLQAQMPQSCFVPIYWIGSEDHDFAEINHLHLFGKTLTWQQEQGGAVGRLPTATLAPLFDELQAILGNSEAANSLIALLRQHYLNHSTLAEATRAWVNHLFGQYGLLVINPDDVLLKQQLFRRIAQQEITHSTAAINSEKLVLKTDAHLREMAYSPQAFVRPINLFYLTDGKRERIEPAEDGNFKTHTDTQYWTTNELLAEIETRSERFSPNVILRPVYQQTVLPAVAWVGGGGELAYWLQLQSTFAHFGAHYPVLVPRNSALWIDENTRKKMERLSLTIADLFRNTEKLVVEYVHKNSEYALNLFAQKETIQIAFEQILERALAIDPTLQSSVVAEMTKVTKSIEVLETKLLRAEKRNFETATNQIRSIKDKLFPEGNLQERYDNMLPFYLKYGDDFIATLMQYFNPLDKVFTIIEQ